MKEYTEEDEAKYQLYSLVNHKGGLTNGHYTAVCQDLSNDQWTCYDDSNVYPYTWTEKERIRNGEAYILFYKKIKSQVTEKKNKKRETRNWKPELEDLLDHQKKSKRMKSKRRKNNGMITKTNILPRTMKRQRIMKIRRSLKIKSKH